MLRGIKYENGKLKVMNQELLPMQTVFIDVKGVGDGWMVLNKMLVKGESATAIVANVSLALDINKEDFHDKKALKSAIEVKVNYLLSAKPYASIMKATCDRIKTLANYLYFDKSLTIYTMKKRLIQALEGTLEKDYTDNKTIGSNGAKFITSHGLGDMKVIILTHGHTGSLATGGWGTALGVVRSLQVMDKLEHVYYTETRSSNVGAYVTAYELVHDKLPATLIIDSVVGTLMKRKRITAVIVGAFSIAMNGDTTNEPGTYQVAVLAKSHRVPFYVAAPTSAINKHVATSEKMGEIEEVIGSHVISAKGVSSWNPSYDITPAVYISSIITEKGVYKPKDLCKLKL